MARLFDLLVTGAGDKRGDPLVHAWRRPLVVGTAHDQDRNRERRQSWHEIEVLDRRRTTKKTTRGGAENSVTNLSPAAGIARLERGGEPTFHRAVDQWSQRACL